MKKRGFTLIELLAVIIILAIIALIATPMVLNVVDLTKKSAAQTEAALVVGSVNKYCQAANALNQIDGTAKCEANTYTKEDLVNMVEGGNFDTASVVFDGNKVTSATITSNGHTVTYNGSTYTIDEEDVDAPDEPVTPPAPTYTAYSVGDDVTLSDGTTWVVVKDTTESESEIKLMSTSNIHSNLMNETGTAMFAPKRIKYDSSENNSNVWANSTLKAYLDSTVKTRLEASLNTTISEITIWGEEELIALGCTVTGNEIDGYSAVSCDNTTEWYSKVFENAELWTKLPHVSYSVSVWINSGGSFDGVNVRSTFGARPVITVSKSVISQ